MSETKSDIDFVVPIHKFNFLNQIVVEAIDKLYYPRTIFIITPQKYINKMILHSVNWDYNTNIKYISDETFFSKKYGLSKADIEQWYVYKDEQSREFGWWFQQIVKLGAFENIPNISDPYIVWDSDLIPIQKWEIYPTSECNYYTFAILQESAKNEWNVEEYKKSIHSLIDMEAEEPDEEGTFVPHHFIFYHNVLRCMMETITQKSNVSWIQSILQLSKEYYRFSEYKCVATYMNTYYPELINYYPFREYGKSGLRYRESSYIVKQIKQWIEKEGDISYAEFYDFVLEYYHTLPSYIQIEHIE